MLNKITKSNVIFIFFTLVLFNFSDYSVLFKTI